VKHSTRVKGHLNGRSFAPFAMESGGAIERACGQFPTPDCRMINPRFTSRSPPPDIEQFGYAHPGHRCRSPEATFCDGYSLFPGNVNELTVLRGLVHSSLGFGAGSGVELFVIFLDGQALCSVHCWGQRR